MQYAQTSQAPRSRALRLGFVLLTDCAPIAMAQELGLFAKYGLHVALRRELGWAAVRDKIVTGELDAAQAVAGMPFATALGLGSIRRDCVTGLVLNLHGNAITLSNELWNLGVRDAASFRDFLQATRGERAFTFGVVFPYSSHAFLLRDWLASAGINPESDVRIVVVPPPQMPGALQAGHIDGCCVGEPWNTIAVQLRAGWVVATSAELAPNHPEKILMVRRAFADHCADEHERLIAALLDACAFCDMPENRPAIAEVLSHRDYLDRPVAALLPGLTGDMDLGHNRVESISDFVRFHSHDANEPSDDKAAWIANHMRTGPLATHTGLTPALTRSIFRCDIYDRACALRSSTRNTNYENKKPEHELACS